MKEHEFFPAAKKAVQKFSYKSNVRFEANARYEGIDINLYADVPDSNDPSKNVTVHIWRTLDPWLLEKDNADRVEVVIETIKALVREYELHEADEWLRLHGRRLADPHPENK